MRSELSGRYAQALRDLWKDGDALEETARVLLGSAPLWSALLDPTVRPGEKERVLRRVLPGAGETLLGFYGVLVRRGRMALLPDILTAYRDLALAESGAARAVMTCVHAPTEEQRRGLCAFLCRRHHRDRVDLEVRLDPALLGGFVLELDGVTYDQSVRGGLRALERQLEEVTTR